MNYFELYDMPVHLKIDQDTMMKKYFELQKKYHPDFFTQATEEEQAIALETSSQLNKALRIFKKEEETIKYVLQLKSLLEEEEKYKLPPDFLMEMMELNEALPEDAEKQVKDRERELYNQVHSILENYNDTLVTNKELLTLKEYYYKKKYLQRILDRITG